MAGLLSAAGAIAGGTLEGLGRGLVAQADEDGKAKREARLLELQHGFAMERQKDSQAFTSTERVATQGYNIEHDTTKFGRDKEMKGIEHGHAVDLVEVQGAQQRLTKATRGEDRDSPAQIEFDRLKDAYKDDPTAFRRALANSKHPETRSIAALGSEPAPPAASAEPGFIDRAVSGVKGLFTPRGESDPATERTAQGLDLRPGNGTRASSSHGAQPRALPSDPKALVKDGVYNTKLGPARWNGTVFERTR